MAKRKKTWAHLRGTGMATAPISDDAKFLEVVAATRQAFERDGITAERAMALWNDAENEKDRLDREHEAAVDPLKVRIAALERIVFAHMEANDIEDTTLGDGRFSRETDPSCKQEKHKVVAWALEHMPDIVSVHSGTLNSIVKDALKSGGTIPDGVEVSLRDRAKRTSA